MDAVLAWDLLLASSLSPTDLQGRFWRKSWDDLNLPDRVKPFFEFVDGYPQVTTTFADNDRFIS